LALLLGEQEESMNPDLEFRGGFVTGLVGGKLLNCMVNPPLAGTAAVGGVYVIQPPLVDPVFGLIAVMTKFFGAGGGSSEIKDYTGNQVFKFWDKSSLGGGAMDGKFFGKFAPGGGAMTGKFWDKSSLGGGAMTGKFWDKSSLGGGAMTGKFWDKSSLGGGSASFVLSSAQIPGRNCLVVHSNFSDLMDALTAAGGATVRFS
jgi:hypothetical protein